MAWHNRYCNQHNTYVRSITTGRAGTNRTRTQTRTADGREIDRGGGPGRSLQLSQGGFPTHISHHDCSPPVMRVRSSPRARISGHRWESPTLFARQRPRDWVQR